MEQCFDKTEPGSSFSEDDEASKSRAKSVGFDCNICLDTVQDPVVTLCGHLYCWPCIYKWIHHQHTTTASQTSQCPVCKSEVSQKTIVPLYGRGQTREENSPTVIPPRPPTPRYDPAGPQLSRGGGFRQRAPPPLVMPGHVDVDLSLSPTMGMLGEMVSGRILGDLETPLFASPNSYNVAGVSTRRARRQVTQADRSLTRIYTFLFCCIIICLLLFT